MGAPTSNRKRGGYSFSLSSFSPLSSPLDSDVHLSKKPKLSNVRLESEAQKPSEVSSSQSTFARVQAYPEPTKRINRVVHAPCRRNYLFSTRMGNTLFRRLGEAKKSALGTFQTPRKDKEVIDLEAEGNKDGISDDSIVEEVGRSDKRRSSERRSVGLLQVLDTTDDVYLKEKYESLPQYHLHGSSSVISELSIQTPPLRNKTPRDDDCGNILESLSITHGVEASEPPHVRLYKDAEKRNSKLSHLSYLIEFTTKKLPSLLRRTSKKPEKDLLEDLFTPLTDEEESEVSRALSNSHRRKHLVTHPDSNIEITGEVLQCLRPGAWLNDEVINLYLELLKEREKRDPERYLKCHFFNTFFYKKLISGKGGYDFKAVRRWTTQRKLGYSLVDCDKIFVPIHKEIHWCLAVINKKDEKFQYLDSLKGRDFKVLEILARYYVDEVKDKSGKDIDVSSWTREYVHDLPPQENGFDCGMFMIKYADFYSRGLGLVFTQVNMPYFRKRTANEVLKLKAL